jgi:hypothetical protein
VFYLSASASTIHVNIASTPGAFLLKLLSFENCWVRLSR